MLSAVLEGGRSADIHEFCFQTGKRSDMDCIELQGGQIADSQEWDLMLRKDQIIRVPSCKRIYLLMLRNSVFTVRNIDIWAVQSSN